MNRRAPIEDAAAKRVRVVNPRPGGWPMLVVRTLAVLVVFAVLAGGAGAFGLYTHLAADLPRIDGFDAVSGSSVTRFEAADGQLVGEWYDERRLAVAWEQLPAKLVLAFLAAEDHRFFDHSGIDLPGVARAMVTNLREGSAREGASTITQQLAKTLVGSSKTYERKVKEAILARRMEDLYTKEQILGWYLNVIYLGHGSYGIQAAAQNYFRKNVWELSIAEMAMLGGLPQQPSRVNPWVDMPAARKRMGHVLANMRERGWITPAEHDAALAEELAVYPLRDRFGDGTPYYTATVRTDVATRYTAADPGESWLSRGLTVSMRVEPTFQRTAERALDEQLRAVQKRQGWPGPLARMEREAFFARSGPWVDTAEGALVLARVAAVEKRSVRVELAAEAFGTLPLSDVKWATPYTEFPLDDQGRRKSGGRVSFDGKLADARKAFAPGDVVLVEVTGPPNEDGSLPLSLAPVPLVEGALVGAGLAWGGVDAMVGGWDFDRSEVNRAFSVRPAGSTMKPVLYAHAYALGMPTSYSLSGAPYSAAKAGKAYNPSGTDASPDTMAWNALAASMRDQSLWLAEWVRDRTNEQEYAAWGERLGLAMPLTGYESEILGGNQTPLGMTRAIGTLANAGVRPDLELVRKVVDGEGRVLERHIEPLDPGAHLGDAAIALWERVRHPPEQAIPLDVAWLTAKNLEQVIEKGTGAKARSLGRPAGGKTGTLPYDVWFVGFTADRLALAWVGEDRLARTIGPSKRDNRVYGSSGALPSWLAYMKATTGRRPKRPIGGEAPPPGIVLVKVDPASGLLTDGKGETLPHRVGTEPTQRVEVEAEKQQVQNVNELETEF